MRSSLVDLDLTLLDGLHRTNTRGTFAVDPQAGRRVRNGGAIINLSSSALGAALPTFGAQRRRVRPLAGKAIQHVTGIDRT
jgi:hypothetical protein